MPIRFQCDGCGQHLSIARRKAGTAVNCPRCGLHQAVPGEPIALEPISTEPTADEPIADEPKQRIEEATVEKGHSEVEEGLPEVEPSAAEAPPSFDWEPSDAQPPPISKEVDLSDTIDLTFPLKVPPIAGAPSRLPPQVPRHGNGRPLKAAPRFRHSWPLSVQVVVLLMVVSAAFITGYYLGRQRGFMTAVKARQTQDEAAADPGTGFTEEEVLLEARLLWTPDVNEASGDEGAVFIALPQGAIPTSALPIDGLQPGSADRPKSQASIAAIRAAGAAFSRAETDGRIAAVLPREGRYYLLMISKHVSRPDDQPIRDGDLAAMKQYFAEPEALIGRNKYVWLSEEIRVGNPAVEHDFGFDRL